MPDQPIYHISPQSDWDAASARGTYDGGPDDRRDGFIHFSTGRQVAESAAKHRAGQVGLVLLTVDPTALGRHLRWEESRGGALFPHLYGSLSPDAVLRVDDVPLDDDGRHVFPPHVAAGDG